MSPNERDSVNESITDSLKVITVLGPIQPEEMGITLCHEHLFVDLWTMDYDYEGILDDEDLLAEEANYFRNAGGSTIVDATNEGIGRNPNGLRTLSERTGLNILMGCGWYREAVYPDWAREITVEELADILVRDLATGVDDTGIKAGFIGEIGTERWQISPQEEKVFRAAALAHKRTGAPILTHTTHLGELALEQVDLLKGEGVPGERIIVSHLGSRRHIGIERNVARAGAFLSIDHIGIWELQHDWQRAANVAALVREGFADQILLSHDVCSLKRLHWMGGHGYDHIEREFVSQLRGAGLSPENIDGFRIHNPRKAFAYRASG